ncbi:DUF2306 domain-containing protein [Sphingomonas sp. G-3-2-10]|uniref:DUF2306 domain-containing protein n=1 Tax=Sphingomonas sp. G-3-2-10 TaxID=2728838 RepID=UPI00146AFE3D|nr:DUF2306 domain-containing protein [Sphingomonas sp. G-3-2-10]NML04612.1 DUF2306 domain-containing protein [Sphingomonas sp. G-3-2-10]
MNRALALALTGLAGAAGWYLCLDISAAAEREMPAARWLWYGGHVAAAAPVLLIAPIQFMAGIRGARPAVHRWLGRVYLGLSLVAGVMAVALGLTMEAQGTELPLVMFGLLWIGFSALAWLAARKRDWTAHRQFTIRSFAIATSFVLLHLLQAGEAVLFGWLDWPELRYATRGWLSLVLPLLAAEAYLSWWPAARRVFAKR